MERVEKESRRRRMATAPQRIQARHLHAPRDYPIQIGRHGSQEVKTGLFNKLKKHIGF